MAKANSSGTRKRTTEKHGLTNTPEYRVWGAMRRRCNSPSCDFYHLYGARGITICPQWDSFTQFLADMGKRPGPEYSIGRIDNDGGYSPENCRWETRQQQTRNTRRSRLILHNGKTQCLKDWAKEFGIDSNVLKYRLNAGWSMDDALTIDSYARNKRHRVISYLGRTQTVTQWAREYGLRFQIVFYRLDRGWSIEQALTTPLRGWAPYRKKQR